MFDLAPPFGRHKILLPETPICDTPPELSPVKRCGAILRPYQTAGIQEIRGTIAAGILRIVAMAATGAGKTCIAAAMARETLEAGKRTIFVVPALSLIDQTVERFEAEGLTDIGVIQADHPRTDPRCLIQIASVQTLQKRVIPEAGLIIIDEVHRWYKYYPKILEAPAFQKVPIIGLTATPGTKGLGKHFDKLIIIATTQQLIDQGYLSPFRAFAPASPDLTGVHIVAGDYHEGELAKAMNKTHLVADVISTWLERAKDRPTLVFAVDRAHAKHLQIKFQEAGIGAEYIDCYTKAPERNEIAKRFHAGEVKVVCNVGCLTTGVDWDVRCIVLARPTRSEMLYVQMVGRGLRIAPGKADCLILDHSDNHLRLGFVTDIDFDHLDKGKEPRKAESKGAALPKPCPKCTFLKPPKTLECPQSGFIPVPQSGAYHADGELIELQSRNAIKPWHDWDKAKFYHELKGYALERGYNKPYGFAYHKFIEKFGHKPPFIWKDLPPAEPSPTTRNWIRSRHIAYAKAKQQAVS